MLQRGSMCYRHAALKQFNTKETDVKQFNSGISVEIRETTAQHHNTSSARQTVVYYC